MTPAPEDSPATATNRPRILLFADPLLRDGLSRLLSAAPCAAEVFTDPAACSRAPQLLIWSVSAPVQPANMLRELQRLEERWQPAPLLLLLPAQPGCSSDWLLQLPVAGLLQDSDPDTLLAAVSTLLAGGRVVELQGDGAPVPEATPLMGPIGLGQWLLQSGLQQIDAELRLCRRLLTPPPDTFLLQLILEGRLRELGAARSLLLWLWGPLVLAWGDAQISDDGGLPSQAVIGDLPQPPASGSTAITLRQRTAEGVWSAIRQRLQESSLAGPLDPHAGTLFALQGLSVERRRDLLLALLGQLDQLLLRLRQERPATDTLEARWQALQPELRRHALRQVAGAYVRLPLDGVLLPVADHLSSTTVLTSDDPELPASLPMLNALMGGQPLLVDGRLLSPDEPTALLHLEALVSNWLIRTAELISAELLACCGDWPELRRYLLVNELLATRSLERLRNQLNAQQRWSSWFERPIQLYESRRLLYRLEAGRITPLLLTEPRDRELRQLGWLQQTVTLALEARDALAPQLQAFLRQLGDLLVVVLTQVIGRAIGLIGRGILQGMGKGINRP